MGNHGSSIMQLRPEFDACVVREWDVKRLEEGWKNVMNGAKEPHTSPRASYSISLDLFVQTFPEIPLREAVRLFKPFSERVVLNRSKMSGCSLTVFTGLCLLTKTALRQKCAFLFSLFDLGEKKSLSPDECTIMLTCVLRAMGTLGEKLPKLLKLKPQDLDELIQEPFHENHCSHLKWRHFRSWAAEFVVHHLTEQVECVVSPQALFGGKKRQRKSKNKESRRHEEDARDESLFGNRPILPSIDHIGSVRTVERRGNNNVDEEMQEGQGDNLASKQGIFGPGNEPAFDRNDLFGGGSSARSQQAADILSEIGSKVGSTASPRSQNVDSARSSLTEIEYHAQKQEQKQEQEQEQEGNFGQSNNDDDDDDDFLDADQAIEQILACLPEIDDGDLSSLPWILEALRLLGEQESAAHLTSVTSHVMPLVCNVAACEDSALSAEAFGVLSLMLNLCPEQVGQVSDTVNEKALVEMCLVRSVDDDVLISSTASVCLYRVAEKQPWGAGRSLAALLEAGTLSESAHVVAQCATFVDQLLDFLPADMEPDLDGRIGLLLSALSLWAHGESPECKHWAKVIISKLGIRFKGSLDFEQAVTNSDSCLLHVWSQGLDPSPEEEAELEQEFERRRSHQDMMSKLTSDEGEPSLLDGYAAAAAERGWIVPAGQVAFKCSPDACMYPQVFAALGFRGPGGPAVGIPEHSAFDLPGSFRRKETIIETKRVELLRVMPNGKVKVWEEMEERKTQTLHLESVCGMFAHREKVRVRCQENLAGKVVNKQVERQDHIHLRNEVGEFSTYVEPQSPMSPMLGQDQSPKSPVIDQDLKSRMSPIGSSNTRLSSPTDAGTDPIIIVEEPFSP